MPTSYTSYGRRADAIVAYTYKADIYCPECIPGQLSVIGLSGMDSRGSFEETVEAFLDLLARFSGIDRHDERTFDSDDFPKVVFSVQVEEPEFCGHCGSEIY
jgi:hypothetical protein